MQLVLHTGAHFTEDDRLVKCLQRNGDLLAERGVSVPPPDRYRRLIRDTLHAMADEAPAANAREVLLDAILDREMPERIILSNAYFFGPPRAAVREGRLYPRAVERLRRITRLFPGDEFDVFMALRNPATFLPAALDRSPQEELADFLGGVSPTEVRWSDLIGALRSELPRIRVTVWCNEDAPLIWSTLLREMAGLEPETKIQGGHDLLADIMSREGMQRFRGYLGKNPGMGDVQMRRVTAAFLEKYGMPEAMEEELDLPGWTQELVEEMTRLYDEDLSVIERMAGVRVIAP